MNPLDPSSTALLVMDDPGARRLRRGLLVVIMIDDFAKRLG